MDTNEQTLVDSMAKLTVAHNNLSDAYIRFSLAFADTALQFKRLQEGSKTANDALSSLPHDQPMFELDNT